MTQPPSSLIVMAAAISLLAGCSTTAPGPTAADYRLPVPQTESERTYLGLPAGATKFQLEDIRAKILVVDCFDLYCHLCQTGAKHLNELYALTQESGLGDRVKFVGLGVGDTPLEVATYKEKLKVPFPVFPDRRASIAKRFGELRVPNLIVLRIRGGQIEVLQRSSGTLLNPAELLSHIEADLAQGALLWTNSLRTAPPDCEETTGCKIRVPPE
jgi:thiol-disulfide isomerase/thioredoxin